MMNDQTPPPSPETHADQPAPPPPGDIPPSDQGGSSSDFTKDEKTMGMLSHLAALAGYMIPMGNVVGPLIVWLIKKDEMPFVDDQGKEAVNFQITVTAAILLCVVAGVATCGIGFIVTVPLMAAIGIVALVFTIIAAIKANEGQYYRYPITYRFIK